MQTKMLYTFAYGNYWSKFGQRFLRTAKALNTKPDRLVIITDRPIDTPYENVVVDTSEFHIDYYQNHFRRKAYEICDCDWLVQVDLDDEMLPNYMDPFDVDCDWYIFGFEHHYLSGLPSTLRQQHWDNIKLDAEEFDFSLGGNSNCAFKMSTLRKINAHSYLRGWEDMNLTLDMKYHNAKVYFETTPRVRRTFHSDSLTATNPQWLKERKRAESETYRRSIMNKIKAGADIHAGDGGYQIGTLEAYEEFNAKRNESLLQSKAIQYVMGFYNVTQDEVEKFYMDEVEAYINLHRKGVFDNE